MSKNRKIYSLMPQFRKIKNLFTEREDLENRNRFNEADKFLHTCLKDLNIGNDIAEITTNNNVFQINFKEANESVVVQYTAQIKTYLSWSFDESPPFAKYPVHYKYYDGSFVYYSTDDDITDAIIEYINKTIRIKIRSAKQRSKKFSRPRDLILYYKNKRKLRYICIQELASTYGVEKLEKVEFDCEQRVENPVENTIFYNLVILVLIASVILWIQMYNVSPYLNILSNLARIMTLTSTSFLASLGVISLFHKVLEYRTVLALSDRKEDLRIIRAAIKQAKHNQSREK